MRIRQAIWPLAFVAWSGAAAAQDPATQAMPEAFAPPAWLSDTVTAPHANIATSAAPRAITVMPIGAVRLDAVGLLPRSVTGLPDDLWANSEAASLAELFLRQPTEGLPAIQAFTEMLALAELDPPQDAGQEAALFLARVDMLLNRGALAQARELIERAGPTNPRVFRRWFDVSLLTGQSARACAAMRANPDIAPTYPARIFCLARSGDWPAAALSLGTGEALGFITQSDADLIARFLDPELFEGQPPLPPETAMTPLHYEMRISLGERPSSVGLPLAFAQSDLADIAGWHAQLDATERLMRAGAIEAGQWQDIYLSRVPSASGGVWDRVAALQAFDTALLARDPMGIERTLAPAVEAMRAVNLVTPFATLYAEPLSRQPLTGEAAELAHMIGLLGQGYEALAQTTVPQSENTRRLFAIAKGEPVAALPGDGPLEAAVTAAFADITPPERYLGLLQTGRSGEALLRASLILSSGDGSDVDDLADALRLLRALGLEGVARQSALQLILLESDRGGI